MIPTQHPLTSPSREDVVTILGAAQAVVESRYKSCNYPYMSEAYQKLFANFFGWLHDGVPPHQILIEAVQDERTILDLYNRQQAKTLVSRKDARGLSNDIFNFPIRNLSVGWLQILLPPGNIMPIYQVDDHPHIKATAQQALANAASVRITTSEFMISPQASARGTGSGKVRDAPSPEHNFPDANFTLAEIAAFLPQSIKSWDMADRVLWNGAGQGDLQKMMNKYRTMPLGKVDNNSVYMMIRGQMRKRTQNEHNYEHWNVWVVGDQKDVPKPHDYDSNSISVTNFRRPVIFKTRNNGAANPIPFKDLADGISVWPEGDDALDLTRCIAWCVHHPEEKYYYPTDYHEVLERVGGPIHPGDGHTDAAVLARLRSGTGRKQFRVRTMHNRNVHKAKPDADGSTSQVSKRKRTDFNDSATNTCGKCTKSSATTSLKAKRDSTAHKTSLLSLHQYPLYGSEDDTEDDAYRGPKRMKKTKEAPRRSVRAKHTIDYGNYELEHDDDEEL